MGGRERGRFASDGASLTGQPQPRLTPEGDLDLEATAHGSARFPHPKLRTQVLRAKTIMSHFIKVSVAGTTVIGTGTFQKTSQILNLSQKQTKNKKESLLIAADCTTDGGEREE